MSTLRSQDFCRVLCRAVVEHHQIDLLAKRVTLSANVTDADTTEHYLVAFNGVTSFGWVSEDPKQRDRMELSVIGLERPDGPQGDWQVYLNPWYTTEIEFQCSEITINGAELLYDGDCLQDSLPEIHEGETDMDA